MFATRDVRDVSEICTKTRHKTDTGTLIFENQNQQTSSNSNARVVTSCDIMYFFLSISNDIQRQNKQSPNSSVSILRGCIQSYGPWVLVTTVKFSSGSAHLHTENKSWSLDSVHSNAAMISNAVLSLGPVHTGQAQLGTQGLDKIDPDRAGSLDISKPAVVRIKCPKRTVFSRENWSYGPQGSDF